jgi:hypothetical protein
MRAPALPAVLLFAFFVFATAAVACSNQGEGDLCDPNNGNNDCQDGLQCTAMNGVTGAVANRYRCCPVLPALPTTAACSLNTSTEIEASTEVPDGGSEPEAGAADAPADVVSIDSPGDVAAPRDAGLEGGADASPE